MHLVSVLFSEPKIPQCVRSTPQLRCRAAFQCSSASRKFLNRRTDVVRPVGCRRFSALQRAENSSIQYPNIVVIRSAKFQCSSASRKFLNRAAGVCQHNEHRIVSVLFSEPKIPQSCDDCTRDHPAALGFSALQRAENSSIRAGVSAGDADRRGFSALQRAENSSIAA